MLRRTVARQLCDHDRIHVNGIAAKASKELKVGDVIEIIRGEKRTVTRVLEIPNSRQVSKQDAASLVEVVSSEKVEDPLLP